MASSQEGPGVLRGTLRSCITLAPMGRGPGLAPSLGPGQGPGSAVYTFCQSAARLWRIDMSAASTKEQSLHELRYAHTGFA